MLEVKMSKRQSIADLMDVGVDPMFELQNERPYPKVRWLIASVITIH